jgi:quercetin dioxygenase-like cupin family protein
MGPESVMPDPDPTPSDPAYTYVPDLTAAADAPLEGGPLRARIVHSDAWMKVLVFPMTEGESIARRRVAHPIVLQVLRGEVCVDLGDDRVRVSGGGWLHVPPSMRHSLCASERATLLMHLLRSEVDDPPQASDDASGADRAER